MKWRDVVIFAWSRRSCAAKCFDTKIPRLCFAQLIRDENTLWFCRYRALYEIKPHLPIKLAKAGNFESEDVISNPLVNHISTYLSPGEYVCL